MCPSRWVPCSPTVPPQLPSNHTGPVLLSSFAVGVAKAQLHEVTVRGAREEQGLSCGCTQALEALCLGLLSPRC